MKVRHKDDPTGFTYLVVDESPCFYIGQVLNHGENHALLKSQYEPIPEETWRDVTENCVPDRNGFIRDVKHDVLICREEGKGYRFHKVMLWKSPTSAVKREDYDNLVLAGFRGVDAFIIEKKEPAEKPHWGGA